MLRCCSQQTEWHVADAKKANYNHNRPSATSWMITKCFSLQTFMKGLWPPNVEMQPQIQVGSWKNEHATLSLSSYVVMSDEGLDCHIVRVGEHLTLPLLQALTTSHLLVSLLFFLSSCICVFTLLLFFLFFLPHLSRSISSALCSVLIFVPWHSCITQPQLLRASHIAQHCPCVDMLFLVNFSESFPPRSWQLRVVGPDSQQS